MTKMDKILNLQTVPLDNFDVLFFLASPGVLHIHGKSCPHSMSYDTERVTVSQSCLTVTIYIRMKASLVTGEPDSKLCVINLPSPVLVHISNFCS